jgi:hypothetical protein
MCCRAWFAVIDEYGAGDLSPGEGLSSKNQGEGIFGEEKSKYTARIGFLLKSFFYVRRITLVIAFLI